MCVTLVRIPTNLIDGHNYSREFLKYTCEHGVNCVHPEPGKNPETRIRKEAVNLGGAVNRNEE